jgi:hypothetical protein
MDIFFGWGLEFSPGAAPSVAINAGHAIFMAHATSDHKLFYRQGVPKHATVVWGAEQQYGDGRSPSVAMNRSRVLGVHRAVKGDGLYYELWSLTDGNLSLLGAKRYDEGEPASVGLNEQGVVLEVHPSQRTRRLWYNAGLLDGSSIDWNAKDDFTDGFDPAVALSTTVGRPNAANGIVTYTRNDSSGKEHVYARLVTTDGRRIKIHSEHRIAEGSESSVALLEDGTIVVCYRQSYHLGIKLMQVVGHVIETSAQWGGEVQYDSGWNAATAAANGRAVQIHQSENRAACFYSTSIVTNRSRWMSQRRYQLGNLPLRELILPGSHDAGMYGTGGSVGQCQDKNLFQQLTYGQRWFDLRVIYTFSDIYIHHGTDPAIAYGPKLSEVLDDIKRYLEEGFPELIILKFSHFDHFDADIWKKMVDQVNEKIGRWIHRQPLPNPITRLVDLTLNDYTMSGRNAYHPSVLVVVDKNWAQDYPHEGFWIYRDSSAHDAHVGQLRVFDKYSNTTDYEVMKKGQIQHFLDYDGKCEDKSFCDLFLLSWTLTSPSGSGIRELAEKANPHLADEVANLPITNAHERIINILFVDYAQYARASDVAIAEKLIG